mmetsp:Transcript_4987/g.19172  ORF Transcript_4987/g.19172 Transcript_4987/m.19172 type:complete len:129 (-) Transcript_4987:723-1109(-)
MNTSPVSNGKRACEYLCGLYAPFCLNFWCCPFSSNELRGAGGVCHRQHVRYGQAKAAPYDLRQTIFLSIHMCVRKLVSVQTTFHVPQCTRGFIRSRAVQDDAAIRGKGAACRLAVANANHGLKSTSEL